MSSMIRRLACLPVVLPLACLGTSEDPLATAPRPNILFVFTDDHASHAISAYGSRINETPNLDRLAREGTLFRNAFCTNSICAPSRAVVLTGKHSHVNGVITNAEVFDGTQQTFPKLLREAGYQTALIGKWHLKSDPTGFDHWEVLRGQGPYWNPKLLTPTGAEEHVGYTTDILTDRALDWLENERDAQRPFLLMFQHKAPHREWQPGPDHFDTYDDVTIPEPDTLFDDWSNRASPAANATMSLRDHLSKLDLKFTPPGNLTEQQLALWHAAYDEENAAFEAAELEGDELLRWRYQRYIKDYLRCIASVDDNVGRVLAWLDGEGLARDTVVVYSSDQGFYLGDHGWYDKRWMYEESLRMPLLVRWPRVVPAGVENTDLVQNLDFAPTFLELCGLDVPEDMQGASFAQRLARPDLDAPWRDSIYYHYWEYPGVHDVARQIGVRTDRYKLIRYYQTDEWEFFDLREDPLELRSAIADERYADVVAELKVELERLRREAGDDLKKPSER